MSKGELLVNLVKSDDPVLTRTAEKIVFPDDSLRGLAADMLVTMITEHGCGLAAPQVGVSKQLFVWAEGGETGIVINPMIVEAGGSVEFVEGCLTYPGKHFRTRRTQMIWCHYHDVDGKRHLDKLDGLRSIIFQHETDHLKGRLLPHHGVEVKEE